MSGAIITGADHIQRVQYLVVRSALKLESKGLKHSGGPIRPKWAAKLGLKPRDSYDKYHEALTKLIEGVVP